MDLIQRFLEQDRDFYKAIIDATVSGVKRRRMA